MREMLTIRLLTFWSRTLANNSILLQIDIPTFSGTAAILQRKSENGATLFNSIFLFSWIRFQGFLNEIEGL